MSEVRRSDRPARIAACPQCGKSARLDPQNGWRPFCSERCKMIDLGAWFSGDRAIPADDETPGEDSSGDDPTRY